MLNEILGILDGFFSEGVLLIWSLLIEDVLLRRFLENEILEVLVFDFLIKDGL